MRDRLTLPFKNDRNYVHGSTLFNAVLDAVEWADQISVKFIKTLYNQPLVTDMLPADADVITAKVSWYVGGQKITRWVLDSGYPVTERIWVNEADHVKDARTMAGSVWQDCDFDHLSFIDRVIGLNKLLLEREFGLTDFWFVKLDLLDFRATRRFLRVNTDKNIGQLVFDSVLLDENNQKIGYIRFVNRAG